MEKRSNMKDELFFQRIESLRGKMYRIAYPYFNSESMAVDAVDEAIYKGYLKKRQLREENFFETWMVRILLNICNSKYKKYKRMVGIEEISEMASPEDLDNLSLKDAIQKLPEKYREVVVLKYFCGYGVAEMAALLDTPQGTVATRLKKSLALLRLELTEGVQ